MVRKFLLATAALSLAGTFANAADMAVKAKAVPYATAYNWTGAYVGLNAGGGFGTSAGNSFNGFIGGGQLGYNWQTGSLVFGVETDIQYSSVKGSGIATANGITINETIKASYVGTLRARVGFAADRLLAYVTGGLAYTTLKHDGVATGAVVGPYSGSNAKAGWTIGGGLEYALSGPWTIGAEYLYVSFSGNTNTYTTTTPGLLVSYDRVKEHVLRGKVNYRF